MTAIALTVQTVLASMVARDFADDLVRAVTFGGNYRPTVRVMLQRHWGAHLDREVIAPIAAAIRSDLWVEGHTEHAYMGFRDNRDPVSHAADVTRLAVELKKRGLQVRISYRNGLAGSLKVTTSKASDALVAAAAPLYIDRINAAIALADAS